jgi:hypothetical protein
MGRNCDGDQTMRRPWRCREASSPEDSFRVVVRCERLVNGVRLHVETALRAVESANCRGAEALLPLQTGAVRDRSTWSQPSIEIDVVQIDEMQPRGGGFWNQVMGSERHSARQCCVPRRRQSVPGPAAYCCGAMPPLRGGLL